MDRPKVDPKGKEVVSTESNYPDEHGYESMSSSAFAGRMGQGKTKTLQAGLPDFCFFLPIPAGWDHPCQKSVVSSSPTAPRPWVAEMKIVTKRGGDPFSPQPRPWPSHRLAERAY